MAETMIKYEPDSNRPEMSSTPKREESDPRNSLLHVLAAAPSPITSKPGQGDMTEDEEENGSIRKASPTNGSVNETRRPQAPSTSSIFSGNKIKHLKKEDGIPLWRKDIQFEFLRHVFENRKPVFSNSYEEKTGYSFADVYIYAMAVSSKTSKILRDKLLSDRRAAVHMAMVCLLVNVGRMNTTLNFFPEMRAQLRTYHSIPCLQARQDPNAYKQLQDAPRLKSILKGASEDKKEPTTIEAVMAQERFRTNPVNLIFVLSQQAVKVTEAHFTAPREFFDLITRTTLSSKSRANAFLWLMWWYLESNFTAEDAKNNPFGPGLSSEDGLSQTVPAFDYLDEDQANNENIDTEEEIAYGELKRLERIKIMEADAAAIAPTPKHRKKGEDHGSPADDARSSSRKGKKGFDPSDTDTRSASPPGRVGSDAPVSRPGRGRWIRDPATRSANTQRLILKTRMDQIHDGSSPVPPGSSHPILHTEGTGRRARPLTAHQQAVERNRAHRVDYILDRKMRKIYKTVGRKRHGEGAVWRAWMRHDAMLDPFVDSEDEGSVVKGASGPVRDQGFGGLMALEIEEDDYGEEISAFAASLRRSGRRLSRWDQLDAMGKGFGVMATTKTVTKSPKGREVFDEDGDKVEDLEDRDEEIDDDGTPDEMEVD